MGKKIKHIVFDFGGVLIDWDPRYVYRRYFNDEERMTYFLTHVCNSEWSSASLDCGGEHSGLYSRPTGRVPGMGGGHRNDCDLVDGHVRRTD